MSVFALILLLQPAHRIAGIAHVTQGQAPFCAAAAALMGASRLGPVPPLLAFVRPLPVSAEGIPWLELADALRPLGVEALVVRLAPDTLRAALAADVPVILGVREPRGRHAVLAVGFDPVSIDIRDPALPTPVKWDGAELDRKWADRQAVLLLPIAETARFQRTLGDWRAQDARYRALEWALRAEKATTPEGMLSLYDRAVAAADLAPLRYNRGRVHLDLGHRVEACADFRAAAADPRWVNAASAAGCP